MYEVKFPDSPLWNNSLDIEGVAHDKTVRFSFILRIENEEKLGCFLCYSD